MQLLLDRGAREEGPPGGHLVVDAAYAPAGSKGQGGIRMGRPALLRLLHQGTKNTLPQMAEGSW